MAEGQKKTSGSKVLGWIAVFVVAVVAGAIGSSLGDEASRALLGESTSDVLDRTWTPQRVGALYILLPEALEPFEITMAPEEREAAASMTTGFKAFQSNAGSVTIMVSHVEYRSHVTVSLSGAAEGAIQRSVATMGVVEPSIEYTRTTVSGLPAIRASVRFTAEGRAGRSEGITISRQRELWQVQTVFPDSPAASRVAERILDSVALAPQS